MREILFFLIRYPNQQQWIIRATNGNGIVHCKTRDEALQILKSVFRVRISDSTR
jgi:hypothetical protein